ncbi:DUF58 domain-containing protein [Salinibaculum rarum]|uniref:DUF58 domain-containing protein n=1 Tax=Salinibaculum rarum TaxID=3058903 RepID=UPI00265FB43D|nr:DUF58 domain-containing protein [Salinibaculum sp. KK48]
MIKHIPRWRSAVGASLLCLAFGALTGAYILFAGAIVPLVYVAISNASGVSTTVKHHVEIERKFTGVPVPGEDVTVKVSVTNTSDAPLPDLRVIDGVPEALRVVDGSPRSTVALPADETATFTYDVLAVRGDHEFTAPIVQARNATATTAIATTIEPDGATQLSSRVSLEDVPLPQQTMNYTGNLPTDHGGEGVEFHATREYRRGDPMTRIHWQHLAKTGELTTVNYREHKAAKVVLVVDARSVSRVAPKPGYPSAVEYSTYAATRIMNSILDDGHMAGIATFGTDTSVTAAHAPLEWIEPGAGAELKARTNTLFETILSETTRNTDTTPTDATTTTTTDTPSKNSTVETATPTADGGMSLTDQLRKHLPSDAQVILFSPVLDDYLTGITRTLRAHGHDISVVSPDVTAPAETPGGALASVDRAQNMDALRDAGAYVINWNPDTPLPLALATTTSPSTRNHGN